MAADVTDADALLRELHELIEVADNSCSEPDDFIRGMRFLFEVLADRIKPSGRKTTERALPVSADAQPGPSRPRPG